MRQLLHWAPRVVAIGFAIFLSLFAFDVFTEYERLLEIMVALFMHLVPTYFVIAATLIAWRWPGKGAVAFALLGIATMLFFRTYQELITFLLVSMPLFVVGVLFYADFRQSQTLASAA